MKGENDPGTESRTPDKKPKSRNKPSDKQKRMADEERGEEIFTFHPSPFTLEEIRVRKKDLILTSREKLQRAYGGCLGAECRRRTWDTAKSLGEL